MTFKDKLQRVVSTLHTIHTNRTDAAAFNRIITWQAAEIERLKDKLDEADDPTWKGLYESLSDAYTELAGEYDKVLNGNDEWKSAFEVANEALHEAHEQLGEAQFLLQLYRDGVEFALDEIKSNSTLHINPVGREVAVIEYSTVVDLFLDFLVNPKGA